jgi:hypothetical protein
MMHPKTKTQGKQPYVATIALTMTFPEERYVVNGVPLEIRTKGAGSSVPIALSRAVRLAFKHPNLKRKSPAYINMSATVTSRWLLGEVASSRPQ